MVTVVKATIKDADDDEQTESGYTPYRPPECRNEFISGNGEDFPDWPDWCFLPMHHWLEIVIAQHHASVGPTLGLVNDTARLAREAGDTYVWHLKNSGIKIGVFVKVGCRAPCCPSMCKHQHS